MQKIIIGSIGKEISIEEAEKISTEWIDKLKPYCHKISAAGTVRRDDREKTNDIDIVLIRDDEYYEEFSKLLDDLECVKGKSDGKWCMRKLPNDVILDIRMCNEDDWGWNLFRHTGPTSFHLFAIEELEDIDKDFATEDDVFDALGMEYIEPFERGLFDEPKENSMNWIANFKNKKIIGEVKSGMIKNAKEKRGFLSIRGFIGSTFFEEGVTDTSVAKALKELGKLDILEVTINSGGGSVFDAFSILTQLRRFDAKIITVIEGIAASAAAFISQAGDEREMSGNALFMYHESAGGVFGNKGVVAKLHKILIKIDSILETTLNKTSKLDLDEIQQLMVDETFFTAEESLEKGFIDSIIADSDEEPHIKPDDKIENTIQEIYKKHAKVYADDEQGFKTLSELVENEIQPDKFSTLPYAPSGFVDNPSLFKLPFIDDNGIVNINGLRYFKARLPLMPSLTTEKRQALLDVISNAEFDFNREKKGGKYQDDKLPSSILLNVVIAGKTQTFVQTQKEIQMNTLIMNALGVTDEKEVLGEIAKLKAFGLASNVVSPFVVNMTNKSPEDLKIMAGAAADIKPEPDALAAIQVQLTQILNQNTILMEENKQLGSGKNSAMDKLEEVIQFKNEGLLAKRREALNEMFHKKHKINPVQLGKAIKDFVDIEPKNVPATEELYQFSLQFYETNEVIDGMETTTGLNPDGDPVLSESAVDKFDAEVSKVLKDKGWNEENEGEFNKAIDIVSLAQPKLAQAYADESAPVSSN